MSAVEGVNTCNTFEHDLRDLSTLLRSVEELTKKIADTQEQTRFADEVMESKEKECQKVKDEHERKILSINRQSRRARSRRPGREFGDVRLDLATPTSTGLFTGPELQQLERILDPEEVKPILDSMRRNGTSSNKDLQALEELLQIRLERVQELNKQVGDQSQAMYIFLQKGTSQNPQFLDSFSLLERHVGSMIDVDVEKMCESSGSFSCSGEPSFFI